jgi:hypothetical protein
MLLPNPDEVIFKPVKFCAWNVEPNISFLDSIFSLGVFVIFSII